MTSLPLLMLLAMAPDAGSSRKIEMLLLPAGTKEEPGVISEETAALEGIGFAISQNLLAKNEAPRLREALKKAYAEMRTEHGVTPSPVIRTLTGRQSSQAFHVLVIPAEHPVSNRAAIYLHGYGGNFTLQCWLFAKAVSSSGYTTVCPSMDSSGRWWQPEGRKIFESTLAWLSKQGRTELILGGLSNGGAGATTLGKLNESKLKALILISGVGTKGPDKLPTLVLHGESDASASYANAKSYAAESTTRTLITWPKGSHYAFLYEREAAAKTISEWLNTH